MEKTERIKIGSVVRLKSGSPPMVCYMKHRPEVSEGQKQGPMLYAVAYFDNERNTIANLFPGLPAGAFEIINLDLASVIDRVADGELHPSYLNLAHNKKSDQGNDDDDYHQGYNDGFTEAVENLGSEYNDGDS